jgi:threonine/homoserine/homoserine lactone efflux protein
VPPAYAVAGFLAAMLPVVATPGASLTLLIQRVTADGHRQALPVILGTATGIGLHATLALAGLSALVLRSSQAFTAVKFAGAVYLVGLGCWIWYSARRDLTHDRTRTRTRERPGRDRRRRSAPRSGYLQALLGNILNPKAALVYLTLVPQFLDPAAPLAGQLLTLATVHIALTACWLLLWAVLLSRAARLLASAACRRAIARISATVLVALGIRTAAASP